MLAPSIGLGALTTIAACAFLLPCRMILFRKLGWTLVLNASISLIFTYSFLAPLLLLAGPRGRSPEVEIQSEELDPDAFGLKSRGVSHGFKAQKQPEKVQLEGCRLGKSHPLGPLAPRPQNACEAELLRMWSAYPSRCQMPKAIVAERGSSKWLLLSFRACKMAPGCPKRAFHLKKGLNSSFSTHGRAMADRDARV